MSRSAWIALIALTLSMLGRAAEPPDDGVKLHRYFTQASAAFSEVEFVQMYRMIKASGIRMGPGDGWFKPGQSRYGWDWLIARFDANKDGKITPDELKGPMFAGLDRDRDGTITSADLDWSDSSSFLRQLAQARQVLQPWDGDGDQKLTKAEWDALFQKLSQGRKEIDAVDLTKLLNPPRPAMPAGMKPPAMPTKALLLERLWTGELGSPFAGPNVGDPAPEFALKTHDGKQKISLMQFRYQKPVVLIFGSFT